MRQSGMNLRWALVASLLYGLAFGSAAFAAPEAEDDEREVKNWQEAPVDMPAAPQPANLLSFYVSASTENRFFIDGTSLALGADGVVRYVLVVQAAGGARNVSFEGMRCETRERRVYASGRPDGSWSRSRNQDWQRIRDVPANRQHTALYYDYFCPGGSIVASVAAALEAFRRGGQPVIKSP